MYWYGMVAGVSTSHYLQEVNLLNADCLERIASQGPILFLGHPVSSSSNAYGCLVPVTGIGTDHEALNTGPGCVVSEAANAASMSFCYCTSKNHEKHSNQLPGLQDD